MGIVFWIGIIAGFLIMRHFAGPLFAKQITGDINRVVQQDPKAIARAKAQLSPQQTQTLRAQGINI
jgi:hypothetical protein